MLAGDFAAFGQPFALALVTGLDAVGLLGRHQAGVDDVVFRTHFGRHFQRGLEHLEMARQTIGFVHEVDGERPMHGIDDIACCAGALQRDKLRLPDLAADDDIHVVGRQFDGLDAEFLDHVEFLGEVGEIVGALMRRDSGAGDG